MTIEYVLDIRHDLGRADRWCPRIRCDGCGELIADGTGNVWWPWVDTEQGQAGVVPYFSHKRCPDGAHREPGWNSEDQPTGTWVTHAPSLWLSEELEYFLVYVVENSGLKYARARAAAMAMAELE